MRLCIAILGIACVLSSSNQTKAGTYYASPQGGGGDSSPENAFTIAQFWDKVRIVRRMAIWSRTQDRREGILSEAGIQ